MSVRDIVDNFEMMGIDISYRTIYNWIDKYSKMAAKYLNDSPKVGDGFRADEV